MSKSTKGSRTARRSGRYTAPLTISYIAYLLGVHRTTASEWLRSGKLDAKPIGGLWRLHEDELPVELPPPKSEGAAIR